MAEERLGASFSIDVTDLKAGLAQANRLIRESESEFKAAAAGMDDWTSSQEGLQAKIKSLNEVTDLQRKRVSALETEYDGLIAGGLDPASRAATELRTKINNEKAALAKNERELQKQQEALDRLAEESENASEAVEEVGEAAKKSGDGFTIMKGTISDLVSSGIQNLVGACKNAIGSIYGLAESTRESRTAFAKLEQSFDTAGFSAETAEKTMSELYGVLGDSDKATEAAALLSKMSDSQADLDANTRILTGVFAEYGDSIPTEGLAEGMAATAAMGNVQGVLADALEWQGVNLDDYNEKLAGMSSEEERAAFIQETLTELYGDSADAYRENNAAIIDANEAQLSFNENMNALGAKIEPITTKIKEGFNKILEKVIELTDGVDVDGFAAKIEGAFDGFIENVIPKIIDGLGWIKDNKDVLIAGIAGIGAAFGAFKVVTLIQSVTSAMKGMSIAQAALNLVMSLNPIGLVVAALAALVVAFTVLWKKCDGFREFWINLWDNVKSFFVDAWNGVMNFCTSTIPKIVNDIVSWFSKLPGKIGEFFADIIRKVADWGSDMIAKGKAAAQGLVESVVSKVEELPGKMISIGKNLVEGIWEGISGSYNWIKGKIEGWVGDVVSFIQKIFGINSPSTVMRDQVGKYLAEGVGVGFTDNMKAVNAEIAQATQAAGASSIGSAPSKAGISPANGAAGKTIVVNQTNNFSQAHSRVELYKARQQTAAAVRQVIGGKAYA